MIVIEPPSTSSGSPAFHLLRKPELAAFLKRAKRALNLHGDVTLLLADDPRIRDLNRSFRGKNKSTDVLSFPAAPNGEGSIGDLAISIPIAAAQAQTHGHSVTQELYILILHGLLHLAGFDHETDTGQMRARESELRRQFDLPTSLIERTAPSPPKTRDTKSPALTRPSARCGTPSNTSTKPKLPTAKAAKPKLAPLEKTGTPSIKLKLGATATAKAKLKPKATPKPVRLSSSKPSRARA